MFTYILRFTIQPGHHEQARFERLVSFCKQAKIDDVMFFVQCEELNQGHITLADIQPWLDMLRGFKPRLAAEGIALSINPWTTLLHSDRGRNLAADQLFRTMCDIKGVQATAQACPTCPAWRDYIAKVYAAYAALEPTVVWVEDDFRFHNHPPLEWGGCFCDTHMAEFSRLAGKQLTREEFIAGVLQPGEPHPYRKIWLDSCRRTTLDNARLIERAVHAVSPKTQIGLMTSIPAVHAAEARDWPELMQAFSSPKAPVIVRPTLAAYRAISPQEYLWTFQSSTTFTTAFCGDVAFYPELDNGPFSTYSASAAYTRLKLTGAAMVGSAGCTLSLFNMMGTGVMYQDKLARMLAAQKPLLAALADLHLNDVQPLGVRTPIDQDVAYSRHTEKGEKMQELYPSHGFFKSLLAAYGVATQVDVRGASKATGNVIAVCDQHLRTLSDTQIGELFASNHLILDGNSVEILLERGLGGLVGAVSGQWLVLESGEQSYEQVDFVVDGVPDARFTAQAFSGEYFRIDYAKTPTPLTTVHRPDGALAGNGQVLAKGHYVFPYGRFSGVPQHLDPVQQAVFQRQLAVWGVPQVAEQANVMLNAYQRGTQKILLIWNCMDDTAEIDLLLPPDWPVAKARLLEAETPQGRAITLQSIGNRHTLPGYTLPPYSLAAIILGDEKE